MEKCTLDRTAPRPRSVPSSDWVGAEEVEVYNTLSSSCRAHLNARRLIRQRSPERASDLVQGSAFLSAMANALAEKGSGVDHKLEIYMMLR